MSNTPANPIYFSSKNAKIQRFSLPYNFMNYILNHPEKISPSLFDKLYRSCKYFLPKFNIIPTCTIKWVAGFHSLPFLNYDGPSDDPSWVYKAIQIPFSQIPTLDFQLYVWGQLSAYSSEIPSNYISTWIPKIFKFELTILFLKKQNLTLEEFKFLVPSVKAITLILVVVKDSEDRIVSLEDLMKFTLNLCSLVFISDIPGQITNKTSQKLAEIPFTQKFTQIILEGVPSDFDVEGYLSFIKRNCYPRTLSLLVKFDAEVADATRQVFKARAEEAIAAFEFKFERSNAFEVQ